MVGPRRAAYEDFYPLAPLQKGLLFHTVEGDDPGVYVVQLHCVLAAGLDVEAFRRAWERIVARHAALRTAFVWRGVKEPVQVVHRDARPELRVEDWSALDEDERRAGLERFLEEDRAAGFALERAPLLRLALFRRAGGEWDFVWSTHHAVVDGWCLPLIVQELVTLYEGYVAGGEVELPQPRPYRDFVAWLHRRDGAATERFWRGELGSFEAPTLLAQALPAPEGEGVGHGEHWRALGEAETEWVRASARRQRVTLGTLAQGAWALVLGRYCGVEDVLYGATVSGRPAELAGAEEMVGLFINTLPVRVAVPGEAEAGAWLGELQGWLAELRGYEHTPLVEVQGWSGVPRGEALFDTLFVFENYALGEAGRVGETALGVREVRTEERTGYAVTVSVLPAGPLAFRYSYDRGRIAPEAVERLGEHVVNVLRALAGSPGVRLGEISLLSEAERAQVVEGWNATGAGYPAGSCVHELFAEQAARTPGAVALVFGAERVTYAELDARADRLAAELRARGVGPDVRVGLCVERSAEMWTGVLAILKAGGAYVPLDPEYPAERLAFMLADSGARTVVAGEVAGRMSFGEGVEVVRVGEGGAFDAPQPAVHPDNLAYVIYTSGSTGRPKGVAVAHRPLVNLVAWQGRDWRRTRGAAVVLQFA
ncbi:MAG TPA: condensation domain-containing protein, partial [Longimicrobiaceae bacterium]